MKHIILLSILLLIFSSCKRIKKDANETTKQVADSGVVVQSETNEMEKLREDSLQLEQARQDSINALNEKKQAVYDQMVGIIKKEGARLKADGGEPEYLEYFTSDLDNDGFPELWIADNSIHANAFTKVYAMQSDGKVKHIGDPGAYGIYHKGKGYLKFEYMHQGGWIIIKYTVKNGKLIKKIIDEGSEWDIEDPAYREMPEVKEPEIKPIAVSNLKPLRQSFHFE